MLMTAVVLNLLVALGLSALAVKYFFGPAPATHHRDIVSSGGGDIDDGTRLVFGALYRAFGGTLFALALTTAALAVFGVYADVMWAKATILAAALLSGIPSA